MQKVDAVASDFPMRSREAALEAPLPRAPSLPHLEGAGLVRRFVGFVSRLNDAQLALFISAVLFAVGAWPLALTEVPPYQDLPNHLAAATIIAHPEKYPEFVFNGFFKTNSALFAWLVVGSRVMSVTVAAKLFALGVLAANALTIPRFVLALTNRRKLVVASLFMWPMVHNWFVSMGMLDFALGVPLSLFAIILLDRQRTQPTWKNAALLLLVTACTWYAHVMPMMVVLMLVAVHVVTRRSWAERIAQAKALVPPLLPVSILVAVSLYKHVTEPVGAMTGFLALRVQLPPWELAYNLWAEWFWGFTWLSITSLLPCLALAAFGIWRAKEDVPFFSPLALALLTLFYLLLPYIATNWFHVNSRFIPFIWMALLVRVPEKLSWTGSRFGQLVSRHGLTALALCAIPYTIGMGVDFVRLDADRAKFTAGIAAVPTGARLLPLIFKRKLTSENTRSLLHAWGFYAMEKQTSAPLLFAHSRSFPLMYKEPPPIQFNHLVLESFANSMQAPTWTCDALRQGGIFVSDCDGMYRARWAEFWGSATPEFDHVLMWDATPEARALVPADYRVKFEQDRLVIFERAGATHASN
jgi:hypothetical protein